MTRKKRFEAQGSTFNISGCTSQEGFSLIELLVTILLSSIVMGAIYSVYRVQTHSMKVQENRVEAQQYARSVLDLMVREIRNAGYAPLPGTTCAGIVAAEAQKIQFRYDVTPDQDCGDPDEDITYSFTTTGQNCPTGFGNIMRKEGTNPAVPLTNCNVATGMANFSFVYYRKDCDNNFSTPVGGGVAACPGTAGGDAGTFVALHRVKITLTIQSKNPNSEFGGQLISTMSSNVKLHNIGTQ